MEALSALRQEIDSTYCSEGDSLCLGAAHLGDETLTHCFVTIPLKMLNRHGLIAGATGSGKTKTLQGMAEGLSDAGVPVLLMDIKGDLSGMAQRGSCHEKINERQQAIGLLHTPQAYPVELFSLTGEDGLQMRATVSEFGPLLLSNVLGLNATQEGILAVIFQYCDEQSLPLLDLADLKQVLRYAGDEGRKKIQKEYGRLSSSSLSAILRKIVALEQQGANAFFGERSFDIEDLMRFNDEGKGVISIVRLSDTQDKPRLFSTFMLSLLAEIYAKLPEAGDLNKPKLVIFFDEAHVLLSQGSRELREQLETIVKLIRSKGVGLIFCTQAPSDIPASILGQLGLKVQHALRAFTASDRKKIKLAAENFPTSEHYDSETLLTNLGVGEALVTGLSEKGRPTPLVHTLLCAPKSRMGILTDNELQQQLASSTLKNKYSKRIDSDSAKERLEAKLKNFRREEQQDMLQSQRRRAKKPSKALRKKGFFQRLFGGRLARQVGRTVARELTRALLGVLGVSGRRR